MYIQCKIFIFWNSITKNNGQVSLEKKSIRIHFLFRLLHIQLTLSPQLAQGGKYPCRHQIWGRVLPQNYGCHLVFLIGELLLLVWNGGYLKLNKIACVGHLQNSEKVFWKINDSVKSSLQKWIISYPRTVQSHIVNYYIKVNFDDGNGVVKTELRQQVLLQVFVYELHIDML